MEMADVLVGSDPFFPLHQDLVLLDPNFPGMFELAVLALEGF